MDHIIKVGDEVGWKWLTGVATGRVVAVDNTRIQIESRGKIITRNGTPEDPAVTIQHANGSLVLKLAHELQVIG